MGDQFSDDECVDIIKNTATKLFHSIGFEWTFADATHEALRSIGAHAGSEYAGNRVWCRVEVDVDGTTVLAWLKIQRIRHTSPLIEFCVTENKTFALLPSGFDQFANYVRSELVRASVS